MTPEAQLMAIAVACGKKCGDDCWYEQVGEDERQHRSDCPCNGTGWNIPDYLNDLNAMHEAELSSIYSKDLGHVYHRLLQEVMRNEPMIVCCGTPVWRWLISATAAQRAEAFLRTLGLWKDDE